MSASSFPFAVAKTSRFLGRSRLVVKVEPRPLKNTLHPKVRGSRPPSWVGSNEIRTFPVAGIHSGTKLRIGVAEVSASEPNTCQLDGFSNTLLTGGGPAVFISIKKVR